ncbi:MAG: cytoplasmic protein, partial [Desulfobacula sp.]|nr:cytoplasmic protein [Desulfobacula sp.]
TLLLSVCRLPESGRIITLRASDLWDVIPGEIITVQPRKQWRYGGHPYLSGEVQSTRLDVKSLGLVPLGLSDMGIWDPREHYWGEEDEPLEEWAESIIASGSRSMFEMEQVIPGEDGNDSFDDAILKAVDLTGSGKKAEARTILMELCQADLRCLDAHSHLGGLVFDHRPDHAIRHYKAGMRIGELSLGIDFTGVLPEFY